MLRKLPDAKVNGRPRGEAIWRFLVRVCVKPFPVHALVANVLRGKAKHKNIKIEIKIRI